LRALKRSADERSEAEAPKNKNKVGQKKAQHL